MVKKTSPFIDTFKHVFAGVLGGMTAFAALGLFSAIFFGLGYYLIIHYNKKNTKPLEELQWGQYLGILFCIIASLPWIQYFFMGFLSEVGGYAFHNLFSGSGNE